MCRDSIAELEIVPVLLQSVQLCFESAKFKVQCLITLAACIEGCGKTPFDFCLILDIQYIIGNMAIYHIYMQVVNEKKRAWFGIIRELVIFFQSQIASNFLRVKECPL